MTQRKNKKGSFLRSNVGRDLGSNNKMLLALKGIYNIGRLGKTASVSKLTFSVLKRE